MARGYWAHFGTNYDAHLVRGHRVGPQHTLGPGQGTAHRQQEGPSETEGGLGRQPRGQPRLNGPAAPRGHHAGKPGADQRLRRTEPPADPARGGRRQDGPQRPDRTLPRSQRIGLLENLRRILQSVGGRVGVADRAMAVAPRYDRWRAGRAHLRIEPPLQRQPVDRAPNGHARDFGDAPGQTHREKLGARHAEPQRAAVSLQKLDRPRP
mmetsp:Transcript_13990/g.36832  ORF Transcript_13990/g.36832 Transcript_13990/m.36832 type:complete len:209 (-) Transcript_13990:131-757(-)